MFHVEQLKGINMNKYGILEIKTLKLAQFEDEAEFKTLAANMKHEKRKFLAFKYDKRVKGFVPFRG